MGQVWELDLPHHQQSVLLAYADHADHDGTGVRPSRALVAWKTGYSEDRVQEITRQLRRAGLLVVVREATPGRPVEYDIDLGAGQRKEPLPKGGRSNHPSPGPKGGRRDGAKGGSQDPPQPSIEPRASGPAAQPPARAGRSDSALGANGSAPALGVELLRTVQRQPEDTGYGARVDLGPAGLVVVEVPDQLPRLNDRRGRRAGIVTPVEYALARVALDAFNEQAESGYTLDAHLPTIVRRLRERPVAAAELRQVVVANFRRPWWRDHPGPQVLWGNAQAWERAIERATGRGPRPASGPRARHPGSGWDPGRIRSGTAEALQRAERRAT